MTKPLFPRNFSVVLTPWDVELGLKISPSRCPFALAFHRKMLWLEIPMELDYAGLPRVIVSPDWVKVYAIGASINMDMPDDAREFQADFDNGRRVVYALPRKFEFKREGYYISDASLAPGFYREIE